MEMTRQEAHQDRKWHLARQTLLEAAHNPELARVKDWKIQPDIWLYMFGMFGSQIKSYNVQLVTPTHTQKKCSYCCNKKKSCQ